MTAGENSQGLRAAELPEGKGSPVLRRRNSQRSMLNVSALSSARRLEWC